ncbi:CdaR family protein [Proteiniclasticum sp. QWL-01]|uniref:CdaR family protein n=1 Tax=Proteiniclasticum sp. QWL-01 TaxID=3036945 RepID=UPI00220AF5BD|nr:CdaR family protein [Proteiniclasticum sp. QWL-01]UUM11860.1 CdaR family protein [Clostridiaceae bacterium HFYG-1003]WFF73351.1 CdaR family protein [Proteiniclasticum sp. QWL-01]
MAKRQVNDLLIKILCIIASIALWVFIINTTNPPQRMTFNNVSVQVQNADTLLAKGLILVPNQQLTVRVPLEGPANDLYSINADAINVTLDVTQRALKVGEQEVQVTYVQTPSGVNLTGSNPAVKLQVDEYLKKPVEIKKDRLIYEAAPGFYVPEPQIDTNFVTVSGPKASVDRVAAVKPISEKKNISQLAREVLKLEALDSDGQIVPNVTLSESYVEVTYIPQPVKVVPVTAIWDGVNASINLVRITAEPTTIRITAKENILKNISEVETGSLNMELIEPGETRRAMPLILPIDVIVLDDANKPKEAIVDVVTVAEPITTKTVTKNVTLTGQPAQGTVTQVPIPITVTISGTQTKLNELSDSLIIITADVTGLDSGTHKVPIKVDLPKDYTLIKTSPETVDITIEP